MHPTILMLAATFMGQEPGAGKADANLEHMKSVASSYRFSLDGDRSGPLKLGAEPSFRMGKQSADDVMDGAVFFWSGDQGRPEAVLQVFQVKNQVDSGGHWVQEFISLSPGSFTSERRGKASWSPRRPGVEFRPIPDAPKPADAPAQRYRQIRALAQDFRVTDNFKNHGWSELRLLPTPVARYGKPGSGVLDGALFTFALATDPEAFVFIEARETPGGLQWQYAFAPMSCFELKGTLKGKAVWDVPYKKDAYDPSKTYFVRLD
jgi:hypothetical protein